MASPSHTPRYAQAARIAGKFGGFRALARAIKRNPTSVYKWSHPKTKGGTDGLIPIGAVPDIALAADLLGLKLTPEDWMP